MTRRRLTWVAGAALVLAVAAAVLLLRAQQGREAARDEAALAAAQSVADAWADGELGASPHLLDPPAVAAAYEDLTAGLGSGVPQSVDLLSVERSGETATARYRVTWAFGEGWTYETTLPLNGDLGTGDGGRWTAAFTPAVVHPELAAGDRLVARRERPERADVLGRDGTPLVTSTPVVEVGVQPSRADDVPALTRTLEDLLGIDGQALRQRIEAADPDAFVPVVTLRRTDYEALREDLQPLPGTVFRESTLPLAPTREFARALFGAAGPVTAEMVEESGGRLAAGDVAGLSGLQRQYDERLGGTAGAVVERIRDEDAEQLFTSPAVAGEPVRLTLDRDVQQAADAALASTTGGNGNAALVALDVTNGEVLAVANTPVSGANRAMVGQYPPGSTFKVVSTLALLRAGLTPEETVNCPPSATVEGRAFRNFEGGAAGHVPFTTDFAESCNTAFIALSQRLQPGDLRDAAEALGVGVEWELGVPVFPGAVPVEESAVELAAASIGQGEVLASPLAMAQAVAAVARGHWVPPSLVTEPRPAAEPPTVPPVDGDRLATVSELMRGVVTGGTASALADVPGAPVHAKTGTAEYGTEDPPRTHAWTVGFRGDLAFAVLVEEGESGGQVAVPVAEAFLRALG